MLKFIHDLLTTVLFIGVMLVFMLIFGWDLITDYIDYQMIADCKEFVDTTHSACKTYK